MWAERSISRTGKWTESPKLVPAGPKVSLFQAMEEEPELRKLEQGDAHHKKLLSIARSLEGLSRHASHARSGVLISDRPLVEYLPLFKGTNEEVTTQFTMEQIERLGLIKFDFLGLKTLTVIKHALTLIEKTRAGKSTSTKSPWMTLPPSSFAAKAKPLACSSLKAQE